ncbi:hypothetical protein B0920_17640 [Massilia sp. KIM]|uniref:hypothetical protein n=1 Tax=Massilia sp. KIM TaxID=1955422 RepID=UPI0009D0B4D6|nr:hypothetical protein [Massilia sp. KIM]OON60776.1 hypothetical protein B0920_17640 [Massilia sp. KIM]
MRTASMIAAFLVAYLAGGAAAQAADKIAEHRITLPAAGKDAVYKGTVQGYGTADYVFIAPAGRPLTIGFTSANPSAYFNLLQDGRDEALHIGSIKGGRYEGELAQQGSYRVRVYLMRNAARKNVKASYQLTLR